MANHDHHTAAHPRGSAVVRVTALTAGLLAVGVMVAAGPPQWTTPIRSAPWWTGALVAIGYAIAERLVFHAEYRNDAFTFSISEAPTAFALVFLDPLTAIVARLVGSLPVIAHQQRPEAYKLTFNASLFFLEVSVAYRVVGAVVIPDLGSNVRLVTGVALAITASTAVGVVAVAGAIACFRGDFLTSLRDVLQPTSITGPISVVIATLALTPALLDLRLAGVGLLPLIAVWLVLLRHGRLEQRHRDLENVHDFTRVVGRTLDMDEIVGTALAEIVHGLRAARGTLVVVDADGDPVVVHEIGGGARPPDGPSDGSLISVPILDGRGVLGSLCVAERQVAADRFDDDDAARAGRFADQLASTLRNALLHRAIGLSAVHDALTNDLNRRGFDEAVDVALAASRPGGSRAAIILDLDRFREINDTFGHHIGDRVIIEFARRVRERLALDDLFGRLGGDEFAVFVERPTDVDVRALVEGIISASHEALTIDEYQMVVSVSAGVAIATANDTDSAQLVRRADVAMYVAKRSHMGAEYYRPDMDRRTPERLALLADLRDVLDDEALEVHFQPKIEISTCRVIGAEALVRWIHPAAGPISPPEFVRVAEESGLIRQLTDQVLHRSLAVAASWASAGFDLGIAVNLSALDLVDEALPRRIESRLEEFSFDPARLTLEITESSLLIDTPRTMATVQRLGELGLRLSLDDFGTGYSSLSYLRRLPAQELKIDRSFVSNVLLDAQDEVIVRSTIDLGHHLGLEVVAEGIENESTLQRLRELDCDLGQGFEIARPLRADEFERWLHSTPHDVRRIGSPGNVVEIAPLRGHPVNT